MTYTRKIDPAAVVTRALAIVDAEGVDAVTMRRVATEVDVTAMSLYRHFADKDALLEAIATHVGTEIEAWRDAHPLPGDADVWARLADRLRPPVEVLMSHHQDVTRLIQSLDAAGHAAAAPAEVVENRAVSRALLQELGVAGAEADQWLYLMRESAFMLANACRPERAAPAGRLLDRGVEMVVAAIRSRAEELGAARPTHERS